MENANEPHPLIPEMPTAQVSGEQAPPPPQPVQKPPTNMLPWVAAAGAVFIGIAIFIGIQQLRPKQTPVVVTATPTITPSPTPLRQLSTIASQVEFSNLETAIASLSASAQSYNVSDPSLSPPEITLPLGF